MREVRYGLKILKDAESEPVTPEEVFASDSSDWVGSPMVMKAVIQAARRRAEAETGRLIGEQLVLMTLDRFPSEKDEFGDVLPLPHSPVLSVEEVWFTSEKDEDLLVSAEHYNADLSTDTARLEAKYGYDWPETLPRIDAVRIVYRAGTPATEQMKEAIKLIAIYWCTHSAEVLPVDERGLAPIPVAALALLQGS